MAAADGAVSGGGLVEVSGRVYGTRLHGRLPAAFAEVLRPAAAGGPARRTVEVSWRPVRQLAAVEELWAAEPEPPRTPDRFALFRHDTGIGLAVHAAGAGRFLLAPGRIDVEWVAPPPGGEERTAESAEAEAAAAEAAHFFASHALPLWLESRGVTVLHAAAVARGGRAVAFLGASGAGKSTLCAELVAAGWSFVADDGLAVEEDAAGAWRCLAGPPWLRLWPSALERRLGVPAAGLPRVRETLEKRRLAAASAETADGGAVAGSGVAEREPELAALYVLAERAERPSLAPLAPAESLLRLVEHSLAAAPLAALGLAADRLDRLARLAARVPVARLAPAAGPDPLGELRQRLLPPPAP